MTPHRFIIILLLRKSKKKLQICKIICKKVLTYGNVSGNINLRKRKEGGIRMFKSELLKGEMVAKKIKAEYLADKIGINITTFYRKLGGESEFNRQEMNIIKNILHLNKDEMDAIFFS